MLALTHRCSHPARRVAPGCWILRPQVRQHSNHQLRSDDQHVEDALRVTWLGVASNLGLSGIKAVGGVCGNSTALIADAAHSFSDLLSDFVTLATVKVARAPPDEDHQYGHGRFEALGALSVSAFLLVSGGGIFVHSIQDIVALQNSDAVLVAPHVLTLAVAVTSIAVKEVLYQQTMVVARRTKSQVLAANAWHHRTDSLSSIVALFGIAMAQQGFPLCDPLAGMVVGAMIVKVAIADIGMAAGRELSDSPLERSLQEKVKACAERVDGVVGVSRLKSRTMGPYSHVDLTVTVQNDLSITSAHQITQRVRFMLLREKRDGETFITNANVYVQPASPDSVGEEGGLKERSPLWADQESPRDTDLMRPHTQVVNDVRTVLDRIPDVLGVSHCQVHYIDGKMTVQVDIVVDPGMRVRDAHRIATDARKKLMLMIPDLDDADLELELDDVHDQDRDETRLPRHDLDDWRDDVPIWAWRDEKPTGGTRGRGGTRFAKP